MDKKTKDKSEDISEDKIVVQNREGRRTILRDGAALILAGTASSFTSTVLGNECDRRAAEGEQKEAGNGSDSDAGENSDRAGCGSGAQISSVINENTASVVKVKG
ncbi:MAG: hypothetical protein V3U65_14070 [Granulosicoccaceae bacterium]